MKTRNELITEAKELGLTFERPVNHTKSEIIEAAIAEATAKAAEEVIADMTENIPEEMSDEAFVAAATGTVEVAKVRKATIANEIMVLSQSGMSRVQIHAKLQLTYPKINYRYVVQTLLKAKAAGIELNVPRQERVYAPKPDAIEALETKLAKMKAAAVLAVAE